jgi:head-tail adaptor
MTAGKRFWRLAFDQPVRTSNRMGGHTADWTEVHVTRGEIRFLPSRKPETEEAGRLLGTATAVVTIPICAAAREITAAWRMRELDSGTVYNIRQTTFSADRRHVTMIAESGVAT